jgi:drug/metabolite transporter (DMT)-like permease
MSGAVLFSAKAICVKLLYRHGVDALSIMTLRMACAAPFFVFMLWRLSRPISNQTATDAPFRWHWRSDAPKIIMLGFLGYYAASYLDFLGLQYVSAGLERLILFLYPAFILLIDGWRHRTPPSRKQWQAFGLAYLSLGLVIHHDWQTLGASAGLGVAFILASALCYALYLVFSAEWVAHFGSIRITAAATLVATCLCFIQFSLMRDWSSLLMYPPEVYGISLVNGFFCTVLPIVLTMYGMAHLGAKQAGLIAFCGPVAMLGLAALFLDEPITIPHILGMFGVMASMYWLRK